MTKSSSSNYGRSLRLAALAEFLCLRVRLCRPFPYGVNVLVNGTRSRGPFSTISGGSVPGPTPVPGWTISSALYGGRLQAIGIPAAFKGNRFGAARMD